MRQKMGIVQALQHDPELAILDEPTEGLDPLMQRAFYDILDTLKAEGRTIFFSSHVLSEVERVCDRVAIVRAGTARRAGGDGWAPRAAQAQRPDALRRAAAEARDACPGVTERRARRRAPDVPMSRAAFGRSSPPSRTRRSSTSRSSPRVSRRRFSSSITRPSRHEPRAPTAHLAFAAHQARPSSRRRWPSGAFCSPLIYARFGAQFGVLMDSGMLPEQFAAFGGGDVFSLAGSIALGFIHPIAIILTSVFAVGFSASAVAGERQRGTLEVALARPMSRQGALLQPACGLVRIHRHHHRGAARRQRQRGDVCGRRRRAGVQERCRSSG